MRDVQTRRFPAALVSSLALVALLVAGACGESLPGPPGLVADRTACAHCGMLISEPELAVAYRAYRGRGSTTEDTRSEAVILAFDDVSCLLAARDKEEAPEQVTAWFQDSAGSGWLPESKAVFVRAASSRTPMASGILAASGRQAAEALAARTGGQIVGSFDDLLAVRAGDLP